MHDEGGALPLPAALFTPPPLTSDAVRRVHLETRLKAEPSRISTITGAAGYGKTTLACQWLSTLKSPWVWIGLDASSATPEIFWRAMTRAVRTLHPEHAFDALDAIGADRTEPVEVARWMVDDLLRQPTDSGTGTIVIDDAHLLGSDVWRNLEPFVVRLPSSLAVVLVSRSDPPFSLARLRAQGRVAEVRQADLVLTMADSAELIERWSGEVPDERLAQVVFARTEGWAAGVRLALMALDEGATIDELSSRAAGQGSVAELLLDEALNRQSPDIRAFLRETSLLMSLSPAVCDAVTGRDDARTVLRRLARDHIFLTPIDGEVEQYRYHPLLAEVLRLELDAEQPSAATEIHRRAARWYDDTGDHPAAIDHALASRDYDLVLDLVVGNLANLVAAGARQQVARWLLQIPQEALGTNADRAVDYCQALLYIIHPEWLRALANARLVVGPDRPDLLARVELFGALTRGGQGHLDRFVAAVELARSIRPPAVDEPYDEVIDSWHARLLMLHGRFEEAVDLALERFRRPRRALPDLTARGVLARAMLGLGDPGGPALIAESVEAWRVAGEPDVPGMADVLAVASGLHLDEGDFEEAENLAMAATALSAERPTHLLGVYAEVAMARVERANGSADDAADRLADLRRRVTETDAAPQLLALIELHPDDSPRRVRAAWTDELTDRERVVLNHLGSHLTFPEIARELYISRHTVKTHVSRIYRKLAVSGRSGAVQEARSRGLL